MNLHTLTPEQLEQLLNRDPAGVARLIDALAPHVRLRVAKVLRRSAVRSNRGTLGLEIEDLSQETFLELFGSGARALRAWDPRRGLTLCAFIQLIAERVTLSRLQTWRRRATDVLPLECAEDCAIDSAQHPDQRVASQHHLCCVLEQLQGKLSPRGLEIFRALFVEGRQLNAVCREFSLKPDAVHAWRSRLGKKIRAIAQDLEPHSERGDAANATPSQL